MPQPQLGKIQVLSARDLWKHEERDFTPWLAQNIDQLSALIGVPIVIDQTEHRVGAYELDILGRVEENDAVVIIENQLSATDHTHLGQLIAYAAGLEAAIVIWIATEIRDEHRAVIEWLNSHTDERSLSSWCARKSFASMILYQPFGSDWRPRQASSVGALRVSWRRRIVLDTSFAADSGKACCSI